MKAILLDPLGSAPFTVTEIAPGLQPLYRALSDESAGIRVDVVEVAMDDELGNTYWVDEEGLLKEQTGLVLLAGAHQPFSGRMVVLGFDADSGDSQDITLDPESLKPRVALVSLQPFFIVRAWSGAGWESVGPAELGLSYPCKLGDALAKTQSFLEARDPGPVRPAAEAVAAEPADGEPS